MSSCNCALLSRGANCPSLSIVGITLINVINHILINYKGCTYTFCTLVCLQVKNFEVVSDKVVREVNNFVNINKIRITTKKYKDKAERRNKEK
jgi:hypothetical protein